MLCNCVGFCCTTMQISHNYTYIPTFWNLPHLTPFYPSRLSQSTRLGSLCYIASSHQLSILHMVVYTCQYYFLHSSSHSLLPPLCSLVCSLYVSPLHAKSLQLCLTLCDPMDCCPPGSPVFGISQARTL